MILLDTKPKLLRKCKSLQSIKSSGLLGALPTRLPPGLCSGPIGGIIATPKTPAENNAPKELWICHWETQESG